MTEVKNDLDSVHDYFFNGNFTHFEIVQFWNQAFPDLLILESNRETLLTLEKKQLVTMMLAARFATGHIYIRFENENAYSLSLMDLYTYVDKIEFIHYVMENSSEFDIELV